MNQELAEIFKNIPLRISVTDYCTLNCFFCSNEGMEGSQKNTSSANLDDLVYLLDVLKKNGLEQVSLTGGDPTCYNNLRGLLEKINSMNLKKTFFHTNGVALTENLIKKDLKNFSKIAVSIHTVNFNEWKKLTGGVKEQFDILIKNLDLLHEEGYSEKVEIKIVPIKGFNDSEKSIKNILDFCSEKKFKFKFLTFEPIEEEHKKLVVPLEEIEKVLYKIGSEKIKDDSLFRGQKNYLPIKKYKYRSTEGVLIEIGCGKKEVCSSCASSNEIFITPSLDIKPCHVSPFLIRLKKAILERNEENIVKLFIESRNFLKKSPGQNVEYWRQLK